MTVTVVDAGPRQISRSVEVAAPAEELFAIVGSSGYLEIAANRGAAAQLLGVGKGTDVSIVLGGAAAAGK